MRTRIKNLLPHFVYFYRYLRYRMLVLVVVSIFVGLLDGFGLAMFLPLLELVANNGEEITAGQMGSFSFIIDGIEALGLKLSLMVILLTIFIFFALKGIAKYIASFLNVVYQQYFTRTIRIQSINALTDYKYDVFVTSNAGAIQNTLSGEVQRVVAAYKRYNLMLQDLVIVVTYAVLAFLANPEFAVLVVIGGVLSNFLFSLLYKKTKVLSKKLVQSNHDYQGLLIQNVAFFKYLKATGSISEYALNLKNKVIEIEERVKGIGVLNSLMQGLREPLMMAIVVAVIVIQVNLLNGNLSTIILSLLFFYRGLSSVMSLQTNYNQFLGYSGSLDNLQNFITDLESAKETYGPAQIEKFNSKIELKDLSFFYREGDIILENINLILNRYETLALVGESGSGKTTLMNIISGLLKPTKGQMLIDGLSSQVVDMRSFRKKIGYITQDPVIFDDTIFNNVTFWAPKTKMNLGRFWEALDKASISSFVRDQPENEDARLGNNGINLSGGQKQRISIARELYKNVEFLFMDEATSALDSETEKAIQDNIDQLKGQYTILIIAHRLSTIKNADRVVVLSKGEIEHIGSYQDLVKQSVSFKRMIELQEL